MKNTFGNSVSVTRTGSAALQAGRSTIFIQGMSKTAKSDSFSIRKPLIAVECDLNPDRFLRISQSEIINLYKVKCFDFNTAGTIGVEFDCGIKTWASRSRVKQIKELFKKNAGRRG